MKIGVLSDSHDHMAMIQAALDAFAAERVEAVIHAGDFIAPFAARMLATFPGPLYAVFGNNDGERDGLARILTGVGPGPLRFELAERRIVVHHHIKDLPADLPGAADVVITGHTHEVVNERRGSRLVLNPGECCGWLTGLATAAILDTETLSARIVTLATGRSWRIG